MEHKTAQSFRMERFVCRRSFLPLTSITHQQKHFVFGRSDGASFSNHASEAVSRDKRSDLDTGERHGTLCAAIASWEKVGSMIVVSR
jgi:hypothetical protein